MWVFGLLCILSVAAALPTPQSSEILESSEPGLFTNIPEGGLPSEEAKEGNNEEKIEEPENPSQSLLQIPNPPELEPIVAPVIVEIESNDIAEKPESSEDKEEKTDDDKKNESGEENKEEENIKPDVQKPVVVTLEANKPSFFANLWSNFPFSWPPSFPSLSNFQFPTLSLPSIFGQGGQARIIYPDYYPVPNYRYVYVK